MKIEETRKVNRIYDISSQDSVYLTAENPITQNIEFEAKETDMEFLGIDSIRIRNDGHYEYGTTIEVKSGVDGEWHFLTGVQSIEIKFNVDNPAPLIKIERYLLKESDLCKKQKLKCE